MSFYLTCKAALENAADQLSKETIDVFLSQELFDPFSDHYRIADWLCEYTLQEDSDLYKLFCSFGVSRKEDMSHLLTEFLWLHLKIKYTT